MAHALASYRLATLSIIIPTSGSFIIRPYDFTYDIANSIHVVRLHRTRCWANAVKYVEYPPA